MHALLLGHSLLMIHSGLQLGGLPKNPEGQEHTGELSLFLHIELGPQGEGSQWFVNVSFGAAETDETHQ